MICWHFLPFVQSYCWHQLLISRSLSLFSAVVFCYKHNEGILKKNKTKADIRAVEATKWTKKGSQLLTCTILSIIHANVFQQLLVFIFNPQLHKQLVLCFLLCVFDREQWCCVNMFLRAQDDLKLLQIGSQLFWQVLYSTRNCFFCQCHAGFVLNWHFLSTMTFTVRVRIRFMMLNQSDSLHRGS